MMTWLNKYALLPLLLAGTAAGADISVTASVDRAEITVGDPIAFAADIVRKVHIVLDLPGLNVALGGFDIRDYHSGDTVNPADSTVTTAIRYTLTTYATGEYRIPPLRVAYYDSVRGDTGSVATDSIAITVKSVAASQAEDILDIKPPAEIRGSRTLLYTLIALAVLVAGGIFFYYLYIRKRWGTAGALFGRREKPPVPPHDEALAALASLAQDNLPAAGRVQEYYFRASEIIRRYQGRRYGCQVLERTTAEIEADMDAMEMPPAEKELFIPFYRACDLVKFASVTPPAAECAALLDRARLIVERTCVREPAPADSYATDESADTQADAAGGTLPAPEEEKH